jgi:hypothetical protein
MGFLSPDYMHDIFISYSHGDYVGDGMSELAAWSQQFAERLERELRLDPRFAAAAVFIDKSKRPEHGLDPMLPLTEEIRYAIEKSALLLALMSPQYVKSKWCTMERAHWLEQHSSDSNFRYRTLFARILPLEDNAWPQEFRDSKGHAPPGIWYHSQKKGGAAVRPFGWNNRKSDNDEYTDALLEFVGTITQRLTSLQNQLEERRRVQQEAQRLEADGGQTLYLYAREEYRVDWKDRYDGLTRAGYEVTPNQPEPRAETPERIREIGQERERQLRGCDALLLLATRDGYKLDGDMLSVGRQARSLARDRTKKLLPCAVMDKSGGSVATAERLAQARRLNLDWIHDSSDWLQKLRAWLQEMRTKLDAVA